MELQSSMFVEQYGVLLSGPQRIKHSIGWIRSLRSKGEVSNVTSRMCVVKMAIGDQIIFTEQYRRIRKMNKRRQPSRRSRASHSELREGAR